MSADEKPKLFRPSVGNRGMNALHYAAYCGDMDELRRQLDAGVDPNAIDQYRGYAPIHWLADMAATGGPRLEMLQLLVARGANVNLPAGNGDTAIELAREAGTVGAEALEQELFKLGAKEESR